MSSISSQHGGASSHHAPNEGHDLSDFNWTLVLWTLPLGVLVLVGFTVVCLFFYRGYLEDETRVKQSLFPTTELTALRLADSEVLSQFKVLDTDKGRIQIPIKQAMEKIVEEHRNSSGRDWTPITDIYLQGAAFKEIQALETKPSPHTEDIIIEEATATPTSNPHHSAPKKSH
jgi:hypothetical protein